MESIPHELCREILCRLPVKLLHRFRCVSKSWLSLINDPDFCRLHLHNFKNNRDETHLLVVEGRQRGCVVRCSDTFESSTRTLRSLGPGPFGYLGPEYTKGYRIKCSIDGLFLLQKSYRRGNSGWERDTLVWNPSIRKVHHIPSLPEIYSSFNEVEIGLGYDPLVKDYKYVKIIRENDNIPPLVAIYTLGAGSWKMIQFKGDWDYGSIYREVVYLQGSLYFLSTHMEVELVSFNLSSEVFCSITNKVPDDIKAYFRQNGKRLRLVRYGCSSLAVFDFESKLFMWVWESDSMCWTKPYLLDSMEWVPYFLYLKKNRDILMGWCDHLSSYNLETGEEKIFWLQQGNYVGLEIYEVHGYIESLFPLK